MVSFPFLLRSGKYKVWHRYCQSIYCFYAICRAEFYLLDCSYFPVRLFLFLLIIIIMMVIIIIILFFCFSVKPKMELFLDYLNVSITEKQLVEMIDTIACCSCCRSSEKLNLVKGFAWLFECQNLFELI